MLKHYMSACLLASALTAVPALAQQAPPSGATQDFVRNAAIGGMFEIQSSQLALNKTQDRDVRQVAQKIIDDHRKADDRLKTLARNERLPDSLDQSHQQMLNTLQGENGSGFIDQYKQMQISAHNEAISLFQGYASNGDDASLKQFAAQTVPTLQQHLQMAQQITVASTGGQNQTLASNGGASNGGSFLTDETPGTWRASKVIGLGVYNQQNEKIGTINEVLFDRTGKVEGAVIGVGGFLGLGERSVAVRYDELKWSMSPGGSANPSGTGTAGAGLGSSASGLTGNNAGSGNGPAAYPDHALLPNASKDQLQKAPQFSYGGAPR